MRCTIAFTGDIMCQIPQNKACQTPDGYDYRPVFAQVRQRLMECDYLVGNLETPLAGESMQYSQALYSFNTPSSFAQALKDTGFDLVSTANNHCVDRKLEGLYRTLECLDETGLDHIGTYASPAARSAPFIADIQGIRVGFIAYTYGTNAFAHRYYLPEDARYAVNLFMPEELKEGAIDLLNEPGIPGRVEALYGKPNAIFDAEIAPLLAQLKGDIDSTRAAGADYVVLLMHSGGQYNPQPDPYTRKLVEIVSGMGVDAIVGNHPHVIHPLVFTERCPVAYSLGNFTYTPGYSPPRQGENPVYSMLLRLTLEKRPEGVKAVDMSCSLLTSVVQADGLSVVMPMDRCILEAKGEKKEALWADYRHFLNKFSGAPSDSPVTPGAWHALSLHLATFPERF